MSEMPDPPTWLSDSEQESWRAYLRASRLLEVALDRDLQSHGIGLSEYELISMLSEAHGGRLRMSYLAELVIQSRSRVTHTASRLERRGWVHREPCQDDRRGVELVLTPEGRQAVEEMALIHVVSVREHLIDVIPPEELAVVGRAMSRIQKREQPNGPQDGVPSR